MVKTVVVVGSEAGHGTFADGSFPRRLRELLLGMESMVLGVDLTRVDKPRVVIASGCGPDVHLHAGFRAAPVDVEVA